MTLDMALRESEYVRPAAGVSTRSRESWLELLKRWLVQCPACAEIRLVVGAKENDQYVCRECGHTFAITRSIRDASPFPQVTGGRTPGVLKEN